MFSHTLDQYVDGVVKIFLIRGDVPWQLSGEIAGWKKPLNLPEPSGPEGRPWHNYVTYLYVFLGRIIIF
jgi:hypothetical protein